MISTKSEIVEHFLNNLFSNSSKTMTLILILVCRSFLKSSLNKKSMKYEELHKMVRKAGRELVRNSGINRIYRKNDRTYPVPFQGSKEVGNGLALKVIKEMGL